ncbi:MAG: SPOR domain-containing protein [Rhodobacteraceae bacterium]|nr:SPOR domain-containing protein [Paracoccaceae bacterium]
MPAIAQNAGITPAETPPAGFEGREYTDSRGCVFLRSTFGGEVTWVPRLDANRQPICNGAQATADPLASDQVRPVPQPAGSAPRPATPEWLGKEREARPGTLRRATPPRPAAPTRSARIRQADASGRHPDCPRNAPYGQPVRTSDGRLMIYCVAHPDHFPEWLVGKDGRISSAPVRLPAPAQLPQPVEPPPYGMRVQFGSFRVAQNAVRVRDHLHAHGVAAHIHQSGGYSVVTSAPFADLAQANRAMQLARVMGLHDAFMFR